MGGTLPFNRALAVLLLTPEFFSPLRQMALKYHAGTAGKTAAERIYGILDSPAKLPAGAAAGEPEPVGKAASGDIVFEGVSLAYENGARPALRGLSCTLRHGQTTALVGPTGAGKSTVAHLLLRFVEPDGGTICAGGVPLAAFEPAAWRSRVAWVSQRPHLFHGTVADNIRLACPGATDEEVVAAARAAHADTFIQGLALGYATPVGERGARLSGGQIQRIAIARAFLKDALLLILDEATVHLDAASEELVQEALGRLRQGRTVLLIAHRLGLAATADQVVVLDGGQAVELGSPADLLGHDGPYHRLFDSYGWLEPVRA
jgi:ABC-type multidrug transport system fused ATPase/permease subunit